MANTRPPYTSEFRRQMVELVNPSVVPPCESCPGFSLNASDSRWVVS